MVEQLPELNMAPMQEPPEGDGPERPVSDPRMDKEAAGPSDSDHVETGEADSPRPGVVLKPVISRPIGHVESDYDTSTRPEVIRASQSRIVVYPEYADGLNGIEESEWITVIFHFHRAEGYELRQHPRGDESRPKRGVFSLCSPRRPNHLGVSFARLLGREGNTLHVTHLDALNGTPVLDLKPFAPPR